MSRTATRVVVEAPGRLHMGVLDLGGSLGRRFGGLGTAAPVPPLLLSARLTEDDAVVATGDDADRAAEFTRRFLTHYAMTRGVELNVQRALPRHAGLGSGTQLGLAVARALAELLDLDTDVESLAAAVGRTRRSGVGMWVFAGGGLVVEGGRRHDRTTAPLLARLPFPASWRCVVAVPNGGGISGRSEERAFNDLSLPDVREAERVAHLVLMALLPALAEGDLPAFGDALSLIQRVTGQWFAPAQGGTFSAASRPLIDRLIALGAVGVGQSSWGPTVYGLVDGDETANAIVDDVTRALGDGGAVFAGPFSTDGARTRRTPV